MLPMLLSLTGCDLVGQSCNLMYAPDFLTLEISGADLSGKVGASVTGDGTTISCIILEGEAEASCDDLQSSASIVDDALTLSLWDFAPDEAELTVWTADTSVKPVTVSPTYAEDEPNGEGCGVRRSATEEVAL
ncbi:MAG: hypothetical protein ACI8RZ_007632 [Myxococcota bacterium]|jgi:hypothetical protein